VSAAIAGLEQTLVCVCLTVPDAASKRGWPGLACSEHINEPGDDGADQFRDRSLARPERFVAQVDTVEFE
jgi:hypothetical protein